MDLIPLKGRFLEALKSSNSLHSLKYNITPENRPGPKRKRNDRLQTIHFQGRTVSFREGNFHPKIGKMIQFDEHISQMG